MKKHIIFLLVTLSASGATAVRDVTRDGLVITVPDGEWKRWSGTCTGDWGWQKEGIEFSIGTRRYLKEDAEYRSTADLYSIHRFADLQPELVAMMEPEGRLLKGDSQKSKDGAEVLVLEFDLAPNKYVPVRTRALYAFREAPDHKSAVEIRCAFTEKQRALATQVFADALGNLREEKKPNQSPEPIPLSRDGAP